MHGCRSAAGRQHPLWDDAEPLHKLSGACGDRLTKNWDEPVGQVCGQNCGAFDARALSEDDCIVGTRTGPRDQRVLARAPDAGHDRDCAVDAGRDFGVAANDFHLQAICSLTGLAHDGLQLLGRGTFSKQQRDQQRERLGPAGRQVVARDVHRQPAEMLPSGSYGIARYHGGPFAKVQRGAVLADAGPAQHVRAAPQMRIHEPRQELRRDFAGLHYDEPSRHIRPLPATTTGLYRPEAERIDGATFRSNSVTGIAITSPPTAWKMFPGTSASAARPITNCSTA